MPRLSQPWPLRATRGLLGGWRSPSRMAARRRSRLHRYRSLQKPGAGAVADDDLRAVGRHRPAEVQGWCARRRQLGLLRPGGPGFVAFEHVGPLLGAGDDDVAEHRDAAADLGLRLGVGSVEHCTLGGVAPAPRPPAEHVDRTASQPPVDAEVGVSDRDDVAPEWRPEARNSEGSDLGLGASGQPLGWCRPSRRPGLVNTNAWFARYAPTTMVSPSMVTAAEPPRGRGDG